MTRIYCSECYSPITIDEKTAQGPGGIIHYECFKKGVSEGEEITLISLYERLEKLGRRVQDLERAVRFLENRTDFKIG